MTRDGLRAAFTASITRHAPYLIPDEVLVDALLAAADQYAAHLIEQHARPCPWPPPRRKRVDEAAARRREAS